MSAIDPLASAVVVAMTGVATRCTCTTAMAREDRRTGRRVICPFCCEPARAEIPRGLNLQGWAETLLDTISWMAERHGESAAQLREVWDALGGHGSDVTQAGAARRVVRERDIARAERFAPVYLVTAHWSYEDEQGWTIERVCSSRELARVHVDGLPPEAYTRGDASWSYQIEEWPVDAAKEGR